VSMKTRGRRAYIVTFAATALAALATAHAANEQAQGIVTAIRHGDCDKAVKATNDAVNSQDPQVDFVAARMIDEGVCVKQDASAATDYYKRSLELGNRASALDYGAKIGLGQGAPQSYEQAGETCRAGGLDAAGSVSTYTLGYACTVRAVAGQMLRESLPKGAIPAGGAALVTFTPTSGALEIRSVPHVALADAQLGSNIRHPMVDARDQIQKNWTRAMAEVPKPDRARLDGKAIELPLDMDMSIEQGRDSPQAQQGSILGGEMVRRVTN
jgi:TPR repeat protein